MTGRDQTSPGKDPSGDTPPASLPTRRSLRQHRRVDSAAGAPAGDPARATILELPAATVSPSDVGTLTGPSPTAWTDETVLPPGTRVDHDGVPLGPDGHPLSRRELREMRRQREEPDAGPTVRRAEAPAGAPRATEPESRTSLAAEGADLAARLQASDTGDPTAVDPDLLREQERLAERARQVNTGLISRVPLPGAAASTPVATSAPGATVPASTPVPAPATPVRAPHTTAPATPAPSTPASTTAGEANREPVRAQSAHGLDSMRASAWSDRERTVLLVAAAAVLVLLVALILALVL